MNRPTNDPFFTDGDPAKQEEPTTGFKNTGWQYKDKVPLEYFNWLFYNIYNFIKYIIGGSGFIKQVASANYTILDDDGYSIILVTTGSSDRTINLPAILTNKSRKLKIKKVDSGIGKVIISRNGTDTIETATSLNLYNQNDLTELGNDEVSDWKNILITEAKQTEILPYTTVGNIGSAGQLQAGHVFIKDEIGTDLALYLAASSGALLIDEVGNFNLTNKGTVVVCDGTGTKKNIFGAAKGFYFDGGANSWLEQLTLLDAVDNNIFISCYITPNDGQPAAKQIVWERYNDANNYLRLAVNTDGAIYLEAKIAGTALTISSNFLLANGGQTYPILIQICKDSVYGLRMWINGNIQYVIGSNTAKAAFTTTTGSFSIGGDHAGASLYTGVVDMVRVQNLVPTWQYMKKEASVKIAIPASLQGKYFNTFAYVKDSNNVERKVNLINCIFMQDTSFLYMYDRLANLGATDQLKIIGE